MSRSTDPGHFFQSESALNQIQRKEQKSSNTLGNPLKLPAKVLALAGHVQWQGHVFAGCSDGAVRLVKLQAEGNNNGGQTKAIKATLRGPEAPVACIATTHNTLYAGSWDKTIYSWSTNLKPARRFEGGHTDFVKAIAVHHIRVEQQDSEEATFNEVLISGGADGYVVVWNADTGSKLHVLRGHTRGILGLDVQLHYNPIQQPHEIPEKLTVWSAGSERAIRRWVLDLHEAKALPFAASLTANEESEATDELIVHETSVNSIGFSILGNTMPEGCTLLHILTASADKTAKLSALHVKSPQPQPVEQATFVHLDFVRDAIGLRAGPTDLSLGYIATACRDEKVRLWDLESPEEPDVVFDGHFEEVTALCGMEVGDEEVLVSGSIDGTVRTWPATREGVERWRVRMEEEERVKAVGLSEDGEVAKEVKGGGVQLTEDEERELAELMDDD